MWRMGGAEWNRRGEVSWEVGNRTTAGGAKRSLQGGGILKETDEAYCGSDVVDDDDDDDDEDDNDGDVDEEEEEEGDDEAEGGEEDEEAGEEEEDIDTPRSCCATLISARSLCCESVDDDEIDCDCDGTTRVLPSNTMLWFTCRFQHP